MTTKAPFFSVGIPAWKSAFLGEAIASVLNQTFTDFELIVVNDASPDPVAGVVAGFSDQRLRYYANESNAGARNMVDNWNKCLSYARGGFFLLLGDDDVLEPDCLAEFASLIGRYPELNAFHCRSKIINERSEHIGYTDSRPEFETVYDAVWHRLKGYRVNYVSDFVYRREPLLAAGGYYKLPMGWASDDISCFELMMEAGLAHTQAAVFCYRQNGASMSNSGDVRLKLEAIAGEQRWLERFLERSPRTEAERVQHRNIAELLPGYIRRKRILTAALFASAGELLWPFGLLSAGLGGVEVVAALLMKVKHVLVKRLIN